MRLENYLYGFNGQLKDDEVYGEGNAYDFGARIYDPRLGRWLAVDPLAIKYPNHSPYNFVANRPIIAIDPDGKDIVIIGSPEDQARIKEGLIKLATESGTGAEIVKAAIASNRTIVIIPLGRPDAGNFVSKINSEYEVMGVNLFNPNKPIEESNGRLVENRLEFTLAHELSHFLSDLDKGRLLGADGTNTNIPADEVNAVEIENKVRKEMSAETRFEYNGIAVENKELSESNKYEGFYILKNKKSYAEMSSKSFKDYDFTKLTVSEEKRGAYMYSGKYVDNGNSDFKRDAFKSGKQTRIYEEGNKNKK